MTWLQMAYIAAMTTAALGVAAAFGYAAMLLRRTGVRAMEPGETQLWTLGDLIRVSVFYMGVLGLAFVCSYLMAPADLPENAREVVGLLSTTFAHTVVCLYVLLLGEIERGKRPVDLGLSLDRVTQQAAKGAALYLCFAPVLIGALVLVSAIAQRTGQRLSPQPVVDLISQEHSLGLLATAVALIVVAAPITEEIIFRGFFFSALRENLGPRRAIVLSAVIFALVHGSLFAMFPIFLLGLLLAWTFHRTRTLAAPIAIHMVHNAATIFFLLYSRIGPSAGG